MEKQDEKSGKGSSWSSMRGLWEEYRDARSGDRSSRWIMLFAIQMVVLSMVSLLDFSPPSEWALILLAMHLVAISCTTTTILWTEHFDRRPDNGIRNRFGGDPSWLAMNLIPILIWAIIINGMHMGIYSVPEASILNEMFETTSVGSPISFTILANGSEPVYWSLLVSQILFFMSSVSGIHVGRPRTHWSLPLSVSVITLIISSLGVISEDAFGTLASMIPLLILSGSCCWLYGKAKRRILTVPLAITLPIGACMSVADSVESTAVQYQIFLLSPILVLLLFLASGWSPRPDSIQSQSTRLAGFAAFSILVVIQLNPEFTDINSSIAELSAAAVVVIYSAIAIRQEHFRSVQPRRHRIIRILERRATSDSDIREFSAGIPIFGLAQSGKTSFLTALWTIVSNPLARGAWWGSADAMDEVLDREQDDLEQLTKFELPHSPSVKEMILSRSSIRTCSELRGTVVKEGGERLPRLPGPSSHFPFEVRASGDAERRLNEFRDRVNNPVQGERDQLNPTIVQSDIELSLRFSATIRTEAKDFFGFELKPKEQESKVRVKIQTFDHPGETFSRAVKLLRDSIGSGVLDDFVSERPLPENLQQRYGLGRRPTKEGVETKRAAQNILHAKSMVFIVDSDALSNPKNPNHAIVQGGTENFLSMISEMRESGHRNLEALQIALNRADSLLPRGSTPRTPDAPVKWVELSESEKSFRLINKQTNHHPENLLFDGVSVDSRFVCNFGGILVEGTTKPPYPMLPVNVMESMISVLMNSNLRSIGE